jgi:hypothetical protein
MRIGPMSSEMIPMGTTTFKDPATERGGGGRILTLGPARSEYLGSIFAQLGRSSGTLSSGRKSSGTMVTMTGKKCKTTTNIKKQQQQKKKKKKKKGKKKKQGKKNGNSKHYASLQNAIGRRESNRKERIGAIPFQMFDSLNSKLFL